MTYAADPMRYSSMPYRRVGHSGLELPAISLGLWQNFGGKDAFETGRAILRRAFDRGITHFDLANNYGPPPGSAEENFGRWMVHDFKPYRDQLVVSSKAGYDMWAGPYGTFGSRKHMIASCDQSLQRMGLDYLDIFYHHRPDPKTPLEETMGALDHIVRSGRALYVGISSYPPELARQAHATLGALGTPFVIHQPSYSMLNRVVEEGLLDTLGELGVGCIAFSPLAQGLLTHRYLNGIPDDSRAARQESTVRARVTEQNLVHIRRLHVIAQTRGQTLAQMAIAWVLRDTRVTSALVGARTVEQLDDSLESLNKLDFDGEELAAIEVALAPLPV
ncbi:MAG: L-glyceraldehyde 3-phosphate reductase [Rhizobiaceae bacterium]|nr:L-glyceraldehyde 3-phosphate reductase [Rhizobiaceae bacterium]